MNARKIALIAAIVLTLAPVVAFAQTAAKPAPRIQIAILLDTSNSMDGLVAQAKQQIWSIVNEFITAKKDGVRPEMTVALYEYGNDRLQAPHIRQVLPLTDDLDKVSQELFALTTNGGQEYCGAVIAKAVEDLAWSATKDDLKMIVIAGNEPFTQGAVDYHGSCKSAAAKGIIVNTIHCGSEQDGIGGMWKDGAVLADGRYMCIDQNSAIVQINAPQDAEIARLGAELNKTYIAYGAEGKAGEASQLVQDSNSSSMSASSNVARQIAKSSGYYRNERWDLVDAMKNDKLKLADVKAADLPEEMQKMSEKERAAFVEQKAKERAEIQAQIQTLNDERKVFVAEAEKKAATENKNLGSVLTDAARDQAVGVGFQF